MIKPAEYNFTAYRGADVRSTFTWSRAGSPVDVTGMTGDCQFRENVDDAVPLLTVTNVTGGLIIGNTDGKITLFLTAENLAALGSILKKVQYAIRLREPSNQDRFFLIYGTVTLTRLATI